VKGGGRLLEEGNISYPVLVWCYFYLLVLEEMGGWGWGWGWGLGEFEG